MKILVACEESQAVTIQLRKLGHDAYSCDLIPCSGGYPEWHIQGDAVKVLKQKWDMIIAFPPCTYISNAGACRLYPTKGNIDNDRYLKGLEAKEFFMLFYNSSCEKVIIENPVSSKVFELPKHTQEVQPYQFGHPFSKKTRLWLKGVEELKHTKLCSEFKPFVASGTGRKNKEKYGVSRSGGSSKSRSVTFLGIAKAMAEQWCGYNDTPKGKTIRKDFRLKRHKKRLSQT